MALQWKALRGSFASSQDCCILVKYDFGPSNYTVSMTDLRRIWKTSCDRRSIIWQALGANTSIDPTEDPGQMGLLLSCIKRALDAEPCTKITVAKHDIRNCLDVSISVELPATLPDFEWQLTLEYAEAEVFVSDMMLPLLAAHANARYERGSLIRLLKEKDTVIAKLMEQMHREGSDFTAAFPGVLSSKISGRTKIAAILDRSVPGMGEFEETVWNSRMANEQPRPAAFTNIVERAMPIPELEFSVRQQLQRTIELTQFSTTIVRLSKIESQDPDLASKVAKNSNGPEDDDFQRQVPFNARKAFDAAVADVSMLDTEDDSTTEEDTGKSDTASRPTRAKSSASISISPDTSGVPRLARDTSRAPMMSGDGPSRTEPQHVKKLGKIGGIKKQPIPLPENPQSSPWENSAVTLHHIPLYEEGQNSEELSGRGIGRYQSSAQHQTRESSQERANRKREELKKELESKSHVAVKKKRKF